jgi:NADPH:quinone reductase-like Zn-dependent oxidoreductase
MKAVVVNSPDGAGELRIASVPVPRPQANHALVRVRAASVGRVDIGIRSGPSVAEFPVVIGLEAAGDVVMVGSGVTECSPGDRVLVLSSSMGRTRPGGCADYVVVPAAELHAIPDNVSYAASVSVGRPFSTAWTALFREGALSSSHRVAIVGAADPVGIAALQICRWKGNPVVAISSGRHAQRLQAIGATRVVSQSAPNLPDHVKAGLGGQGASLVVNTLGEALAASQDMLDIEGRLIFTTGGAAQLLDTRRLVELRARVIGSADGSDASDVRHIHKLLGEATFLPVIDSIFPMTQANEAHRRARSETVFGAVLLVPDDMFESAQ